MYMGDMIEKDMCLRVCPFWTQAVFIEKKYGICVQKGIRFALTSLGIYILSSISALFSTQFFILSTYSRSSLSDLCFRPTKCVKVTQK